IVGGGRPTFALPVIDKNKVAQHVEVIHRHGLKFNYLLNAVCLDNRETTREFNREIRELMEWLGQIKVDYVTVSAPMLIEMVRNILPHVKISLSTFANVTTISQARFFRDLGVTEITLPESKNRDFRFLETLKAGFADDDGLRFQLIATNDCLFNCPLRYFHPNFQGHASQSWHITGGFALDYCMVRCTYFKLLHPEELLKSPWIRPEDLKIYEDLGYEKFKLTERMKTTEKIAAVTGSYFQRKYEGNLLRLLNTRMHEEDFEVPRFSALMDGKNIAPHKMAATIRLIFALKANLPNAALEHFLDGFKSRERGDCRDLDCATCGYCKGWADQVLEMTCRVDEELQKFNEWFDEIGSGELFAGEKPAEENTMEWLTETTHVLEKLIGMKPEMFRAMAEREIKKKAEEFAADSGEPYVMPQHVAKANIECTPADFKQFARSDVKSLGFDPAAL
ncbi:MAG TPA: U32 family peptidase, partial [Candidatus Deferrimicrobium sp.]|nr:U32 family peptidase [Candidatus Deferrimicrobium sp.]